MADAFLLENGVDRYQLEDASGLYLNEQDALSVSPASIGLSLTAVAPQVRLRVIPAAFNLSLSPVAPVILAPKTVAVGAIGLTLAPIAPTTLMRVTPAAASMSLSLTISGLQVVAIAIAPSYQLTLTPMAPFLGAAVVPVDPASLTLTLYQPVGVGTWGAPWGDPWGSTAGTVRVLQQANPAPLGLTLGTPAPSFSQGAAQAQNVSPASLSLTVSPVSTGGWGITHWGGPWGSGETGMQVVSIGAVSSLALSLGLPAPNLGLPVAPGTIALTLTPVAPELRGPVEPETIGLSLALEDPEVLSGVVVPSIDLVLGIPEFSILRVSPPALDLSITPVAPSIGAGVRPTSLSLSLSVQAPQVRETAQLASIGLVLVPIAPNVLRAQSITPTSLGLLLGLGAPVIAAGVFGTPVIDGDAVFDGGGSSVVLVGAGATVGWGSGGNTT